MFGGFVRWEKGTREDGTDSIAVQVADEHVRECVFVCVFVCVCVREILTIIIIIVSLSILSLSYMIYVALA